MKRTKPSRTAAHARQDGPLFFRPPEKITFGTGKSALGPVLVASSGKGIASIMIRRKADELVRDLRQRFPKANLIRREKECKSLVARVVGFIAAPVGRFDLPLDERGTAFQRRVWQEVRRIPLGRTSTYSKVAEAIGAPKAIRAVAGSCSRCWFAFAIPCHRVLHTAGAGRKPDRRDGRQYAWAAYEARVHARRAQ